MSQGNFPGVNNPVVQPSLTSPEVRVITPAHSDAFFMQRKLKPFQPFRLSYAMSAITNGPHLTPGRVAELTPKRGVMNNERVLPYVDTNFAQEIYNCKAVLYVSI